MQCQAKVFGQARNPAVLDARVRLEFEGRNDRPGIDLRHASLHVKFKTFRFDRARPQFQLVFIQLLAAFALAQKGSGRKFVIRVALRDLWLAGFLGGGLLCVTIEDKDRSLAGCVLFFLFVLFFDFLIGEPDGLRRIIHELGSSKKLRRDRLTAR